MSVRNTITCNSITYHMNAQPSYYAELIHLDNFNLCLLYIFPALAHLNKKNVINFSKTICTEHNPECLTHPLMLIINFVRIFKSSS